MENAKHESGKVTHAYAKYRQGTKARHCSICTMYRAAQPHPHCTYVLDPIRGMGDCRFFVKLKDAS